MKFMYEIKDVETGQILTPVAITGLDAGKLLGCSQTTIHNAYHGGYLLKGRYMVRQVDTVIPKNDSIWIDWDLQRNWLLKLCGRKK